MAKTEWDPSGSADQFPPAATEFDQVGPASGNEHLSDAPAEAAKNAAMAAFGEGAAGNSPADNGWDIGKD